MKLQIIVAILILFFSCKKNTKQVEEPIATAPTSSKYNCVPQVTDAEWYETDKVAPLLEGYDVIHYPITTKNSLAQTYFNQGMLFILSYAFNHAEAARSFYYAY